jgi:hypothetical protein
MAGSEKLCLQVTQNWVKIFICRLPGESPLIQIMTFFKTAALPGSIARQHCPAALPGSIARQHCPAANFFTAAMQFISSLPRP